MNIQKAPKFSWNDYQPGTPFKPSQPPDNSESGWPSDDFAMNPNPNGYTPNPVVVAKMMTASAFTCGTAGAALGATLFHAPLPLAGAGVLLGAYIGLNLGISLSYPDN